MKAKELKIGDIVQYEGTVLTIEEVGYDLCSGTDNDGVWLGTIPCERITPIPLTEEVLEKSGWRKSEYMSVRGRATLYRLGSTADRGRTVVCFYAQGIFLEMWQGHNIVRKEIKYVHQLQHLLWAQGLDDELKI